MLPQWHMQTVTLFAAMPTRKHVPMRTRAFVDFLLATFGVSPRDPVAGGGGLRELLRPGVVIGKSVELVRSEESRSPIPVQNVADQARPRNDAMRSFPAGPFNEFLNQDTGGPRDRAASHRRS